MSNYQPLTYEPTKQLFDLFQSKFGKVWESEYQLKSINDLDHINYITAVNVNNKLVRYEEKISSTINLYSIANVIPAITLSTFCQFVDENFNFTYLSWKNENQKDYPQTDWYINEVLKHFAIDNWDEPELIIKEIKKYL